MLERARAVLRKTYFSIAVTTCGLCYAGAQSDHPAGQAEEKVYALQPAKSLSENPLDKGGYVTAALVDADGGIWFGVEDQGVFHFDPSASFSSQWLHFTTNQGLGDNNGYALASDMNGRLWVGTQNHGVSVFNGESWKVYDRTMGPLGERIFALGCCPVMGDVWIGSSLGLARYSAVKDSWRYYTRFNGLPADQIQTLAFGKKGRIYIGTQCDGMAMAGPEDDYTKWTFISALQNSPQTPTGTGLPANMINQLFVDRDDTVYAATPSGLARSANGGLNWNYTRGLDCVAKIKGHTGGSPHGWQEPGKEILETLLPSDHVTCITQDAAGSIWLGFRGKGIAALDPRTGRLLFRDNKTGSHLRAILPLARNDACLASYGGGARILPLKLPSNQLSKTSGQKNQITTQAVKNPPFKVASASHPAPFPTPAPALNAASLADKVAYLEKLPHSELKAVYLGDDWSTQGDWVGRYGRQSATLCAMAAPMDHNAAFGPYIRIGHVIGPHHQDPDAIRHWVHWRYTKDPRCLYTQVCGTRRESEWDDHGEAYPLSWEGPDIWISVEVPEGVFRLSFYFINPNGHQPGESSRDYLLELKASSRPLEQNIHPNPDYFREAEAAPVLARARVRDFWHGVYKRFIVTGPGCYLLKIGRNHSFNTIVSAVLADQLAGPTEMTLGGDANILTPETMWIPFVGDYRNHITYQRPGMPVLIPGQTDTAILAARDLTSHLDNHAGEASTWLLQEPFRLLAYRAALQARASPDLLANMRWKLPVWTAADRAEFTQTMALGWEREQETRKYQQELAAQREKENLKQNP